MHIINYCVKVKQIKGRAAIIKFTRRHPDRRAKANNQARAVNFLGGRPPAHPRLPPPRLAAASQPLFPRALSPLWRRAPRPNQVWRENVHWGSCTNELVCTCVLPVHRSAAVIVCMLCAWACSWVTMNVHECECSRISASTSVRLCANASAFPCSHTHAYTGVRMHSCVHE